MEEVPKIVRERLRGAAKVEVHPDANLLAAFAEKSLTPREQAQVLEHLGVCAECREVVAIAAPEMEVMVAAAAVGARFAAAPVYAAPPSVARAKWPYMRWMTVAACVVVVAGAAFLLRPKSPTARQVSNETVASKAETAPQPSAEAENKVEAKLQPAAPPVISFDQEKLEVQKLASARKTRDELRREQPALRGFVALDRTMAAPPPSPPPPTAQQAVSAPSSSITAVGAGASGGVSAGALAKMDAGKKKEESLGDRVIQEADANTPSKTTESVEVSSANEMVTVEAAPVQTSTVEVAPSKAASPPALARAKRADKDAKQVADTSALSMGRTANAIGSFAENLKLPFLRWTISLDGKLLRSLDEGKTWQPAALSATEILRALSVTGPEVWVGGAHGALYHSSDSGTSWQQIKLTSGGLVLTSDITHIASSAPKHGVVTTSDKQTWTTFDGGHTWQRE